MFTKRPNSYNLPKILTLEGIPLFLMSVTVPVMRDAGVITNTTDTSFPIAELGGSSYGTSGRHYMLGIIWFLCLHCQVLFRALKCVELSTSPVNTISQQSWFVPAWVLRFPARTLSSPTSYGL